MDPSSPKPLGSGRPERYEIDDAVMASTSNTYTLLKTFDASHIFSKHPHKYDKLVAQEDGYSKDDSAFSDSELTKGRMQSFSDPTKPRQRTRSNSLSNLDVTAVESALEVVTTPLAKGQLDQLDSDYAAPNRADRMYRRCSLDHMADYYTRRSSDAAVSTIWNAPGQASEGGSSRKTSVETAVTSYMPSKSNVEGFGERHLTDIMMKAAFEDPKKVPVKKQTTEGPTGIEPQAPKADRPPPFSSSPARRRMSAPEPDRDAEQQEGLKTTTVYPPARKLFGIGPMYRPLPETVVEGVTSHDGPLTDRIRREGIDTTKDSGVPVRKAAPTKAEMNAWAPFSM